jgi:hypothetical protein
MLKIWQGFLMNLLSFKDKIMIRSVRKICKYLSCITMVKVVFPKRFDFDLFQPDILCFLS